MLKPGREELKVAAERLLSRPKLQISAATRLQPDYPDHSFGVVELKWFEHWSKDHDADYAEQVQIRLGKDVLPALGDRPIAEVEAPEPKKRIFG